MYQHPEVSEEAWTLIREMAVRAEPWRVAHTLVLEQPTTVTLENFVMDWPKWAGSFDVRFDNKLVLEAVEFSPDCAGWPSYRLSSCEMTVPSQKALRRALRTAIPKLLGVGKPRHPDSWPAYDSRWCKYLSEANLLDAKERLTPEYQIEVDVQQK